MSRDPILYEAGDPNLYRYVGDSPLTRTDPMGEGPWPWQWPIWPWNWSDETQDDALDACGTCAGAGAPAGAGEVAGGMACIAEMCQPNNIENYLKLQMNMYKDFGPQSEYLKWKQRYEKCKQMREDAAKKKADEAAESGCCK